MAVSYSDKYCIFHLVFLFLYSLLFCFAIASNWMGIDRSALCYAFATIQQQKTSDFVVLWSSKKKSSLERVISWLILEQERFTLESHWFHTPISTRLWAAKLETHWTRNIVMSFLFRSINTTAVIFAFLSKLFEWISLAVAYTWISFEGLLLVILSKLELQRWNE